MKEIDQAFTTLRTNMVFLNSNYDPSLKYPVTTFFDKRYQTGIDPQYKTRQVIEPQENQIMRQDSWYDTSFAANDPILFFTSVGMSPNQYLINDTVKGAIVMEFRFRESNVYIQYTRTYYNIFTLLTTVGGLWTSLNGVGLAFNTLFSYNLMMSSIIAKMYNFKAKFPEERKEKKKKKKGKA
jgi:hypothetical protein